MKKFFTPKGALLLCELVIYGLFVLSMFIGTFDYFSVIGIAAGLGAISGFNVRFYEWAKSKREWLLNYFLQFRIATLITFVAMYATNPRFVGTWNGFFIWLGLPILLNVLYSMKRYSDAHQDEKKMPRRYYGIALIPVVMLIGYAVTFSSRVAISAIRPEVLAEQLGEVDTEKSFATDYPEQYPSELRAKMDKVALAEMRTAFKEGSQYSIDEAHLTLIFLEDSPELPPELKEFANRLVWVAPNQHEGGFTMFTSSFFGANHISGYVICDAITRGKVKYIETLTINGEKTPVSVVFSPSSLGFRNLNRHQWFGGDKFSELKEIHFSLDKQGLPNWVLLRTEPLIWTEGNELKGAVAMNASTGKATFYSMDNIPEWIDNVIPDEIALERATFWGEYRGGLGSRISRAELYRPTTYPVGDEMDGAEQAAVWQVERDKKLYSITGMTSVSQNDQAIVSILEIDCTTEKATIYRIDEPSPDEHDIIKIVNGAYPEGRSNRKGTQPIVFRYPGSRTVSWFVPVADPDNTIQEFAIVHGRTRHVVLGETVDDVTKRYELYLIDQEELVVVKEDLELVKGEVSVWNVGEDGIVRFRLKDNPNFYQVPRNKSETLLWTAVGDNVEIGFNPPKGKIVPVQSFENLNH